MATTTQDTEITLGTGRMLTLFFVLVFTWAIFFAVGFSLGRKAAGGPERVSAAPAATPGAGMRPAAGKNNSPQSQNSDFSFYKAVEQKNADAQLAPAQETSTPSASSHSSGDSSEAASGSGAQSASQGAGGYFVQVAAVSRQEDAEALVEALKKKQYPAFTSNNSGSDKFFHVQVGPFTDLKDAETMRGRLVGDGYNPIVKK